MPQISPIHWIFVILLFLVSMMIINNLLPNFILNTTNKMKVTTHHKPFSW